MAGAFDPGALASDLARERQAFVASLRTAGPEARTLLEGWTALDLAAHVAATEQLRGVPTFLGRRAIARFGWRLNDTFEPIMAFDRRRYAGRGFDEALARLSRPIPGLLLTRRVLPVAVFEIVVHHEDLRRGAGPAPPRSPEVDVLPSIEWLVWYQRRLLDGSPVRVQLADGRAREFPGGRAERPLSLHGPALEVLLWLAGRQEVADVEVDGKGGDALRV